MNAKVILFCLLGALLFVGSSPVRAAPAPVITCPANITVASLSVACGYVVTLTEPVIVDDGGLDLLVVQSLGYEPLSLWPVGCTETQYTIYNEVTGDVVEVCDFSVCIEDTTPPTIVCPADQTVIIPSGETEIAVEFTPAVGYDNCCGFCAVQVDGVASGSVVGLGTISNYFEVTDAAGLQATCIQTIEVVAEA